MPATLREIVIAHLRNMGNGGLKFDQITDDQIAEHLEAERQSWHRWVTWYEGQKAANTKLARWIIGHCDHWNGDHACAECFPDGRSQGPIIPGFRCAVHVAKGTLNH